MPLASDKICGNCLQTTLPYQNIHYINIYEGALQQMICQFKFNAQLRLGRALAELLYQRVAYSYMGSYPQALIPVPLHYYRLAMRGFNQANEIAKYLAKKLQIKVDNRYCRRRKATPPQTGLSATSRQQNVKNAFELTAKIAYQHIAIIDDVYTTGSTLRALCATYLKQNPLLQIDIWVLARAVHS